MHVRAQTRIALAAKLIAILTIFSHSGYTGESDATYPDGYGPSPALPAPSPPIGWRGSRVIGWPQGAAPVAPPGFRVMAFARDIESPRWLHVLPNGDVLVAQSSFSREVFGQIALGPDDLAALRDGGLLRPSPNKITLLRDTDGHGAADFRETFLDALDHPFGMALSGGGLYIAMTGGLWRFPYRAGDARLAGAGRKIMDLPAGNRNPHWTRNVVLHPKESKLYVTVGSITNADEEGLDRQDEWRAAIIEADLDGSNPRVFASGLRNPVGMDWAPDTADLWTVVNERDHLGPDLPPDFLARVEENGFYGWPYAYFGDREDPAHAGKEPRLAKRAIKPDYALGAHTSPLGLVFQRGALGSFGMGAFISQHGSMRSRDLAGYRVIFVPFENGRPAGPPKEFLTGFIANREKREVYGRPAGLAFAAGGGLLVADDAGDRVWLVAPE